MPAKKSAHSGDRSEPSKKTPTANKAAAKKPKSAKETSATKPLAGDQKSAIDPPAAPLPSPDEIAHGAYLNYRSRLENGQHGDPAGDWLHAEYCLQKDRDPQ